jgi:hypothetical protein
MDEERQQLDVTINSIYVHCIIDNIKKLTV